MAHEVIWYSSDEVGAPTLNNAAGSLVGVLDACLLDGFNAKSVTSIVVASNVATVTVSAHGYGTDRIVLLAGATPSGLNGRKKITVAGANTFTFPTSGVSDQTASGTITCKRAPLDWAKQFTGTNKAVYARTDVAATASVLRVNDTHSNTAAAVTMGDSAVDVDTLVNPAPSVPSPNQLYWNKGDNSSSAKTWLLIGDGRTFYFFSQRSGTALQGSAAFGDLVSFKPSDPFCAFIAGDSSDSGGNSLLQSAYTARSFSGGSYTFVVARAAWGLGKDVELNIVGNSDGQRIGGSEFAAYPSPVDNGIVIQIPTLVKENQPSFNHPIRGALPGMGAPLGHLASAIQHYQVLPVVANFPNAMLAAELGGQGKAVAVFDLVGPWQ